jgi:hypothetical protein
MIERMCDSLRRSGRALTGKVPAHSEDVREDVVSVTERPSGSDEKLAELVLYVAQKLRDDPTGGATKLNKVLYFAEFAHTRAYGEPITGVPYQKLPRGPAPRRLLPIREWLIQSGAAVMEQDQFLGYPLHRLVPKREPDLSLLSETAVKMVDQVIQSLWGQTAEQTSERSHEEAGWRIVEYGDDIPYEAAYLPSRVAVTNSVREHAAELAERLGRG